MKKMSLTLHDLTAEQVNACMELVTGEPATAEKRETKVTKPKAAKAKAKPSVDDDEDEDADDEEETEDEETEEDDESDDEDEDEDKFAEVVNAFKAFTKSFKSTTEAQKARKLILKKFKVDQPSDLEPKDFPAVLKAIRLASKKK